MSHHEAPGSWPFTGEQPDGSFAYPSPSNSGIEAGPMPELFPDDAENLTRACREVRENIDRKLHMLLDDDLSMHYTVRDILAGLIKIKNTQGNNG